MQHFIEHSKVFIIHRILFPLAISVSNALRRNYSIDLLEIRCPPYAYYRVISLISLRRSPACEVIRESAIMAWESFYGKVFPRTTLVDLWGFISAKWILSPFFFPSRLRESGRDLFSHSLFHFSPPFAKIAKASKDHFSRGWVRPTASRSGQRKVQSRGNNSSAGKGKRWDGRRKAAEGRTEQKKAPKRKKSDWAGKRSDRKRDNICEGKMTEVERTNDPPDIHDRRHSRS